MCHTFRKFKAMWILENINGRNICAFRDFSFSPRTGVVTVVTGSNEDDDSQNSNGSGKSALIEAVAIALTGDNLRRVRMEEIINDNEQRAEVNAVLRNVATGTRLTISRQLSRTQPQQVSITRTAADGTETTQAEASVYDYNKAILEILGISKEDLFSSFLLSRHRYTSFLMSSDKEKKDIINEFSNASLVDVPMEILDADIKEVQGHMWKAESDIAYFDGRIDALDSELEVARENDEERHRKIKETVAAKREELASTRSKVASLESQLRELRELAESRRKDVSRVRSAINRISHERDKAMESIESVLRELDLETAAPRDRIDSVNREIDGCSGKTLAAKELLKTAATAYRKASDEYDRFLSGYEERMRDFDSKTQWHMESLKRIDTLLDGCKDNIKRYEGLVNGLDHEIDVLNVALKGLVSCPKCSAEFDVRSGDSKEDIEALLADKVELATGYRNELSTLEANRNEYLERIEKTKGYIDRIASERRSVELRHDGLRQASEKAKEEMDTAARRVEGLERDMKHLQEEVRRCRDRYVQDALEMVERKFSRCTKDVEGMERELENARGVCESLENAIEALGKQKVDDGLADMRHRAAQLRVQRDDKVRQREGIRKRLDVLEAQMYRFKEFKTHLANTRIAALADMTNMFLENIGSGIRVRFSGYTMLKNGTVRDRISINLLRDGVDCGSFGKFSEGEKARVNLACILAMFRLCNLNAPVGKGVGFLIVDELLDTTDEKGLANIFHSLNDLGITSIIVTHGLVPESYPYRLTVCKRNGVSTITEN